MLMHEKKLINKVEYFNGKYTGENLYSFNIEPLRKKCASNTSE